MSFVPEEELKGGLKQPMAPMIDFLFLMLMFFACLAVTRATTKDIDIDLVEASPETEASLAEAGAEYKILNISINAEGEYKWVAEIRDHLLETPEAIKNELLAQYQKGILPEDPKKTQVLLKIDKAAPWEPILKAIFAVRDAGFEVRPVYEPEQN